MTNVRKSMFLGTTLILSIYFPIFVHAGCSQSDLAGTWYTHSISIDSSGTKYAPQVGCCKMKINSSGSIVGSSSSCKARTHNGLHNSNITGGNIKVSSKCGLSGSIKSSGTTDKGILEYGKLSKDKTTFSGIGYNDGYRDWIVHISGVKQ